MRPLLAEPSRLDFWCATWRRRTHGRRKKRYLWVTETRQHRLQHFKSEIYGRVEGWLGDRMWQIVVALAGVTEGFYRFMASRNRRLNPFPYFQNKLFLTTVSEHDHCLRQFGAGIEAAWEDEFRADRWKEVEIASAECLSFA